MITILKIDYCQLWFCLGGIDSGTSPLIYFDGGDKKKTNKLSLIFLGYVLNKALLTIVFFDVNRENLIKYYCEVYNIDISLPLTILFTSQQY